MLLPIKNTPIHSLVHTLTGGGDGRRADGGRSLDRFGVDAHGGILTTYRKVAGSGFGLGVTWLLGMLFQLFLGRLERRQVVARPDGIIVVDLLDGIGIFAVWKGEVGVEQYHENHQREEGDATKEVGQEEAGPAPHFYFSLAGEMMEGNGDKARTKMGRGFTLLLTPNTHGLPARMRR